MNKIVIVIFLMPSLLPHFKRNLTLILCPSELLDTVSPRLSSICKAFGGAVTGSFRFTKAAQSELGGPAQAAFDGSVKLHWAHSSHFWSNGSRKIDGPPGGRGKGNWAM